MATQQGAYDNPSYLTRQQIVLGVTTAGANGSSLLTPLSPTSAIRVRNAAAVVITSGSSSTTGAQVIFGCVGTCTQFGTTGVGTVGTATTTLGTIALGTSTVGVVATSGDLNVTINQGAYIYCKNGTDATEVARVILEAHIDPNSVFTGA